MNVFTEVWEVNSIISIGQSSKWLLRYHTGLCELWQLLYPFVSVHIDNSFEEYAGGMEYHIGVNNVMLINTICITYISNEATLYVAFNT